MTAVYAINPARKLWNEDGTPWTHGRPFVRRRISCGPAYTGGPDHVVMLDPVPTVDEYYGVRR